MEKRKDDERRGKMMGTVKVEMEAVERRWSRGREGGGRRKDM